MNLFISERDLKPKILKNKEHLTILVKKVANRIEELDQQTNSLKKLI
jgi:hypothetical protein